MVSKEEIFEGLAKAVIDGDEVKSEELAKKSLEIGIDPYESLMNGCNKGMAKVSDLYELKEMFVPEILLSADAMYAAIDILKPHLKVDTSAKKPAKVVIGVAQGDIHDIGKNLVKMMLEVAGFIMIDVGKDVPVDTFVKKTIEEDADIVAISALMTTSMMYMEPVIKKLKENTAKAKVVIGGAPINNDFANKIGADGYGKDAVEAVKVSKKLVGA